MQKYTHRFGWRHSKVAKNGKRRAFGMSVDTKLIGCISKCGSSHIKSNFKNNVMTLYVQM
jgi:hypothetical protein